MGRVEVVGVAAVGAAEGVDGGEEWIGSGGELFVVGVGAVGEEGGVGGAGGGVLPLVVAAVGGAVGLDGLEIWGGWIGECGEEAGVAAVVDEVVGPVNWDGC